MAVAVDAIRITHCLPYPLTGTTRCRRISRRRRHVTSTSSSTRRRAATVAPPRRRRPRQPKSRNPNWSSTVSRPTGRLPDSSRASPTSRSSTRRSPSATTSNRPKYDESPSLAAAPFFELTFSLFFCCATRNHNYLLYLISRAAIARPHICWQTSQENLICRVYIF